MHLRSCFTLQYLQRYHFISIAPTRLSPAPHISHLSPPLLQIPHLLHPMADFLFWQKSCCALLASHTLTHTHTHTHTDTHTHTAWPWPSRSPSGVQGHQRGSGRLTGVHVIVCCLWLRVLPPGSCLHFLSCCPSTHGWGRVWRRGDITSLLSYLFSKTHKKKNEPALDACCAWHAFFFFFFNKEGGGWNQTAGIQRWLQMGEKMATCVHRKDVNFHIHLFLAPTFKRF